jgi:hypothetical protein
MQCLEARGTTPACGRATTRRASGLEDYRISCAVEVMEGRETVGVTVVAPDAPNEPVTIEAPAGGTAALIISVDAIDSVRRMLLTTPPSILPLRANSLSNWCALLCGARAVGSCWQFRTHDAFPRV